MSIKFTIPNAATKVDWAATSVSDGGATIPVINKPSFSAVASSGAYADLTGKPAFATVASSGAYADLTGKPAFATVATSGKYTDLTAQPTIPSKLSQLTNDTLAVTGSSVAAGGLLIQGLVDASTSLPASMLSFPIVAMTSNTGPGGFTASASSMLDALRSPFRAFDKSTANQWASASGRYDGTTGAYVGTAVTTVSGSSVSGEWVQLQTPVPYRMYSYTVTDSGGREKQWTLAGSVDGVTWTSINTQNLTTAVNGAVLYNVPSPGGAYSYFRFIVQAIFPVGQTVTDLSELVFNGQPVNTGDLIVTGALTAGGIVTLPAPVAAVWYPTGNATVAAGSVAAYTGTWTQQSFSRVPSGVTLLTGTTITIPYNGIYNISFSARFSTATGENGLWLQGGSGNLLNRRLSAVDVATGLLNGAAVYTGYFAAGDTVSPIIYSSTVNTIVAGSDVMLSLTMLQRAT